MVLSIELDQLPTLWYKRGVFYPETVLFLCKKHWNAVLKTLESDVFYTTLYRSATYAISMCGVLWLGPHQTILYVMRCSNHQR